MATTKAERAARLRGLQEDALEGGDEHRVGDAVAQQQAHQRLQQA